MSASVEFKSPLTVLPAIRGIYDAKITDRSPALIAAGKLIQNGGESALTCLKPTYRPVSADVIKRFRASVRPDAGKIRVLYGKAGDPQLQWADEMTHGVLTPPSDKAHQMMNPPPTSLYSQRLIDKKENLYASLAKAPLGRSHDQTRCVPPHIDLVRSTFGVRAERDGCVGELINPDKTPGEIAAESEEGRELYKVTHGSYLMCERKTRDYVDMPQGPGVMYGKPSPHDNSGKQTEKIMRWIHDERCEKKATPIVSKRVDDFRERTQHQLSKVHDPIKDTLNVGADHTFGIQIKPDEYGLGDLLHNRTPQQYLRGTERIRSQIAAMRQHLKKSHYQNFADLESAFKHCDKDNKGYIGLEELKDSCKQFNLPVDLNLLVELMEYCDANSDGRIDYTEFVNFLNWKDKTPLDVQLQHAAANRKPTTDSNIPKQIDPSVNDKTSSSMINAVVGGISTKGYRTYGVPTVRTDRGEPRIKRISDNTNYGDVSDAYGLCNPSFFSNMGVYEKDFLKPRSKLEIRNIFLNIGVEMDAETYDGLWAVAAGRHPKGDVSVEAFRCVLDEAQAFLLTSKSKLV